jgi:hypothetical protein
MSHLKKTKTHEKFSEGDDKALSYTNTGSSDSYSVYLNIAMEVPKGIDLEENAREAKKMNPIQFYKAVKNTGKWDYKQKSPAYQDFGNFNFGYVGLVTEYH